MMAAIPARTKSLSSDRPRESPAATDDHLRDVLRSLRAPFATIFVFGFFISLLTLTVPLYLIQIYDKVLPGGNLDTLVTLTVIALIAVVALAALEAIRRGLLSKIGVRLDVQLGDHLLNSAIHRSVVKARPSTSILGDLATVRQFLATPTVLPLLDVPWTPLFVFGLWWLHPLLGMVGIVGCVIMVALAVLNERLARDSAGAASRESGALRGQAETWIRHADAVQAMGMQSDLRQRWKTRNALVLTRGHSADTLNARLASLSKFARLVLQVLIVCVAAWLITSRQLTAGVTIASMLLLRRAITPLEQSIRSWKSVIKSREAFQNIREYLDHATSLSADPAMPVPAGTLVAERIGFRHPGAERSVISRADLVVEPGSICAITGPNASGKSSLLRLLAGVVEPGSGRVTLGGYELSQWTAEQRGPYVGFQPQSVSLLAGTVAENIARFTDYGIDEVITAAERARVHDLIQRLPNGYETEVREDGRNLSGGQRQAIGLARALFRSPCLVVLDEPDANLDSASRSRLRKTLRQLRRDGLAVILTTHHDSVEEVADRHYRLENGKLSLVADAKRDSDEGSEEGAAAANDPSEQSVPSERAVLGDTRLVRQVAGLRAVGRVNAAGSRYTQVEAPEQTAGGSVVVDHPRVGLATVAATATDEAWPLPTQPSQEPVAVADSPAGPSPLSRLRARRARRSRLANRYAT